jgi:hypothetical protein
VAVRTLRYMQLIGNKWVGSGEAKNIEKDMDALLSDGWTIVSDETIPGNNRRFSLNKKTTRVITYHKA